MLKIQTLPMDVQVRVPTMDDLHAVYELINRCDLADDGKLDLTLDELSTFWQTPSFHLASDAWLVVTADQQAVGYADIDHEGYGKIFSFIRVLPEYRGRGIESHLLNLVEDRAGQRISEAPSHGRVALYNSLSHQDKSTAHMLEQAGFTFVRSFWRMEIEMDKAPQAPQWPESITVRNLHVGQEEHAVFEMIQEAFQDHWGHTPTTFEQWASWLLNPEILDPTLWFLAFDGDKLAGGALCRTSEELQMGWVGQLAVRRPWRRKGLGMALLLHAFGEFYQRGHHTIGLGVDSQNLTGATRLYERAGMHVALQHDSYEKELRPGQDLRTLSLSE